MVMLNFAKMGRYKLPYYKTWEHELLNLTKDLATNYVDHPHNTNPNEPVWFKDCSDGVAGASFLLYTKEHVQYEQMMMDKELEKVEIPDDGFFSSIGVDDEQDVEDEMKLFQDSCLGEDFTVIDMSD